MATSPSLLLPLLALLLAPLPAPAAARQVYKMDFSWRFQQERGPPPPCSPGAFPIDMNNTQCYGLAQQQAAGPDECAATCCAQLACETWQWCPAGANDCGPPGTCWVGQRSGCVPSAGWVSQGRNRTAPGGGNCSVAECQPGYNDSTWRLLDVPHDFVVEGTFTPTAEQSHGYLPTGRAWYRKHFTLPAFFEGTSLWLQFDGVYRAAEAYLNGVFLGSHASGYTSFALDFSALPGVVYGDDNVLAVHVDATEDEGWWYEGGGIYRHVWLVQADPLHIARDGVFVYSTVISSVRDTPQGQQADAVLNINTSVVNGHAAARTATLVSAIIAPNGTTLGTVKSPLTLPGQQSVRLLQTIILPDTLLWSPDYPNMLTVRSALVADDGSEVDAVDTTTGVRRVVFDRDLGLLLNDRPVKIKGLCNHQDFAGCGVAVPDRVNQFRVEKLKEMGGNAWRMSHNPPNPELLDMADRLGMLVWDENRHLDNVSDYFEDMTSMVLRDRNHPSVVIWSLCNEGGCMENANDTQALAIAQAFKDVIRANDATRVVSAAWNAQLSDLLYGWGPKVLDLQGVNYNYNSLDPFHAAFPAKPLVSSETASCTCARGVYVTNDTAAHKDVFTCDGCAMQWWTADATRAFVAGGFAWTGFDYKGEPTPYAWPEVNSNFGILDIAAFPKDTFYYYQAWWTDQPVLHLLPHWNDPFGGEAFALHVAPCDAANVDEHFVLAADPAGGVIRSHTGLCVDGTCGDLGSGCYPLQLVPCDAAAPSQIFALTPANTVVNKASGGCLDVYGGTGPQVGIYHCNGGSNQNWQYDAGSMVLRSGLVGQCLSDTQAMQVYAYTNADSVQLWVNGRSAGPRVVPQLGKAAWDVVYSPGSLYAVAYNADGSVVAQQVVNTTGAPYAIALTVEVGQGGIRADGQDVALLRAAVVDVAGLVVPTASNFITFATRGPGSVYGVGNGDPSCHEPDKASTRSAFNGLARVIVQATDVPGDIYVTASAPGLQDGVAVVHTHVVPAPWMRL